MTRWLTGLGLVLLACAPSGGGDGGAEDIGDPAGDPPAEGGMEGGGVCDGALHTGEGTYYGADGSGNCSFPAAPGDPLVAAMNDADYAASAVCGACVEVEGPDATITVRIVDRCPGCAPGDIDLSEGAFPMIAAKELGRVPISWRVVSCPVSGPIVYHFKEGSNQWWTAVQVRNHRNPIATFEYKTMDGSWKSVERVDYNFFIDTAGMGTGPYSFRVTDVEGNVLEDDGVPFVEAGDSPGSGQFAACAD
jgi:expansin (peptidoglycan-binding protein)